MMIKTATDILANRSSNNIRVFEALMKGNITRATDLTLKHMGYTLDCYENGDTFTSEEGTTDEDLILACLTIRSTHGPVLKTAMKHSARLEVIHLMTRH